MRSPTASKVPSPRSAILIAPSPSGSDPVQVAGLRGRTTAMDAPRPRHAMGCPLAWTLLLEQVKAVASGRDLDGSELRKNRLGPVAPRRGETALLAIEAEVGSPSGGGGTGHDLLWCVGIPEEERR